ncbi:unnamed protein product [Parnassius apollo]|uniref:(apollo) hypothetical protein n=1 Tax=Parnassius apollo TaxID=110799 RepID=A0A8S3XRN3_PARAO|nr:unnamed protein product [Parnassius apollo]
MPLEKIIESEISSDIVKKESPTAKDHFLDNGNDEIITSVEDLDNDLLTPNYLLNSMPLEKIIESKISSDIVKKESPTAKDHFLDNGNDEITTSVENLDNDLLKVYVSDKCSEREDKNVSLNSKLQCHDCGSFFKSKCKLRVHWKKTHLLSSLICPSCKRAFKSYKAYHTHIKTKRKSCTVAASGMINIIGVGKARVFHCKECAYKTKRVKDIQTHLVIHSGDRPFQCEMCSNTFTQLSSLQTHKESAHKEYKMEITCHFCGKFVKGRVKVYRHLRSHTDAKIPCSICFKMLNKKSYRPHMQRHSGVKSYTCEKCASTFFTSAELCNHRRKVHKRQEYIFKCDLCEYKSNRSDTVKRHKRKHTGTNFPCTICGMFFFCVQKLNQHERIHFEEKKYSCPHCDVKFHGRDSVRKHIRMKHKYLISANSKTASVRVKDETAIVNPPNTDLIKTESSPI